VNKHALVRNGRSDSGPRRDVFTEFYVRDTNHYQLLLIIVIKNIAIITMNSMPLVVPIERFAMPKSAQFCKTFDFNDMIEFNISLFYHSYCRFSFAVERLGFLKKY